ncbi:TetR/AcrR family transcriptional regulator [Microbacterium sp. MYb62]|uniref:TetR/AcrR family transcriptional regulator n=1 Tax=Microbacterium sp. MYb62 TaxID=1848690 RepID=UPI0015E41967|nr:TetR/AcrR family transcriptional regulator [Microbacterium sp. MYb62]
MSERRDRIRAAAERLFAEQGYENTTTKQIAEEAEVGEATLFRYVSNKRELLLLMLGDGLDQTLRMIRDEDARRAPSCATPQDFVDRVYAIHQARAEFYLTDPDNVLRYLQFGLTAGSTLGLESIRQGDEVIAITKAVLDTADDAGLLLPGVSTQAAATNCNGIYIHEVLRTPVRDYQPESLWDRMRARLAAQIEPLFPGLRT